MARSRHNGCLSPVCAFVPVGRNYSRANSPPMHVSRGTLSIMQNHYPERLHHCFLVNAPWLFRAGWRVRLQRGCGRVPSRIAKLCLLSLTCCLWCCWYVTQVLSPFVDAVTKAKLEFVTRTDKAAFAKVGGGHLHSLAHVMKESVCQPQPAHRKHVLPH